MFNVDRAFVRSCTTPMLVLMGNDLYHPEKTSREIVDLAPNAELGERWHAPDIVGYTVRCVRAILETNTP